MTTPDGSDINGGDMGANRRAGALADVTAVEALREAEERFKAQAEAALRASEERYRSLFEHMLDGFAYCQMLYDERGQPEDFVYLAVNDAFGRLTGLTDVIGRRVTDIIPRIKELTPEVFEIYGRVARTGEAERFEIDFTPLGRYFSIAVFSPATGYFVAVFDDITARKRAEEALRGANVALAEADRRKDEFIAILSHELRNPLAPIRYALPVLGAQRLDEAGSRALTVVARQVDQLVRLVDDLLDVSRITHGKIELRREYMTLDSILTAAVEAASPSVAAGRHTLRIVAPDDPVWLYADAARMTQVVINLLDNSAKYTPKGGEILLQAERDKDGLVIRVRDNGLGIPAEALPTVFEMFRQVEEPGRPQKGLGIGLALVKLLVEMHGGSIEAHSSGSDQGAEFCVWLPMAEGMSAAREPSTPMTATHRRLRVLVVDDNADLLEMLAVTVAAAGHDVRKAPNGPSGLSAALSYRPDVVLLDIGLPGMSGLDVARELRRRPETRSVRLIAMTGWGQAEDRRQTLDAGFDRHLTKPADPDTVRRLLVEIASEEKHAPL